MVSNQRTSIQAWGWAFGINLIIFIIIWIALINIPAPVHSEDEPETRIAENESQPAEVEPSVAIPVSTNGSGETLGHIDQSVGTSTESTTPETWTSEFYLGNGPPLSFAPRLNEDGTPRPHPNIPGLYKAPTYEDEDTNYTSDNINPPRMTPSFFSRADLPEEYRDRNFSVTVNVHIDARGRVLDIPEIIESTGFNEVDQIVIDKIRNDVSFEPATLKDTGQPVSVVWPLWITWED